LDVLIKEFKGEHLDEFNEKMWGWYWIVVDENENPISHQMGPYGSARHAQRACQAAIDRGDKI